MVQACVSISLSLLLALTFFISQSTLLPDIELSLDTRDASTASFAALQARVAPVLGSLEACKRRKRTPTSIEECGEEAVMTLVAKKPEGETELRWSWSKGMEFRAPQA